jgi:hypothetical protein
LVLEKGERFASPIRQIFDGPAKQFPRFVSRQWLEASFPLDHRAGAAPGYGLDRPGGESHPKTGLCRAGRSRRTFCDQPGAEPAGRLPCPIPGAAIGRVGLAQKRLGLPRQRQRTKPGRRGAKPFVARGGARGANRRRFRAFSVAQLSLHRLLFHQDPAEQIGLQSAIEHRSLGRKPVEVVAKTLQSKCGRIRRLVRVGEQSGQPEIVVARLAYDFVLQGALLRPLLGRHADQGLVAKRLGSG